MVEALRYHAPPSWPRPPEGWVPPAGWTPDPSWPPAPVGWVFWRPKQGSSLSPSPSAISVVTPAVAAVIASPRMNVGRALGLAAIAGYVLIFALSAGLPGFFGSLGLVTVVLGIVALFRGRLFWVWLPTRAAACAALALGLVLFTLGGALAPTEPTARAMAPSVNSLTAAAAVPKPTVEERYALWTASSRLSRQLDAKRDRPGRVADAEGNAAARTWLLKEP